MSNSSTIPPLSTLLSRGGPRGRGGRGRGRGGGPEGSTSRAAQHDQTIQGTDNDAASSRASAVVQGYLSDPYALIFGPIPPPRRYPLINRGTYVRTTALDRLIDLFLSTPDVKGRRKQIISLGAGSDTRFFRIAARYGGDVVYHEIDFAINAAAKVAKILGTSNLKAAVQVANPKAADVEIAEGQQALYSASLNVHPLDLRDLVSPAAPPAPLRNLDPSLPTLILSECCLTYLPVSAANSVLSHFLSSVLHDSTPAAALFYEPILPRDAFGQTMVSNLSSRAIIMPSLHALPTLESHRRRLRTLGLQQAGARSVRHIYATSAPRATTTNEGTSSSSRSPTPTGTAPQPHRSTPGEEWISDAERARVEKLEWLDEVEEWNLLASHYCIVWGSRSGGDAGDDIFGCAWSGVAGHWQEEERGDDDVHASPGNGHGATSNDWKEG